MTEAGTVYGQALYDLAKSEGLTEQILKELSVLRRSFEEEPDFIRLLSTPALTKQERCDILDQCFRNKCHLYLLNFLKILTEKGYIRHFSHCCDAYRDQYNRDNGILPVTAVTAVPITEAQQKKLIAKLEALTGKTVEFHSRIDASCLGGVRLDYDGKRVDDTVAYRLDTLRARLKNTVL